MLFDIYDSGRKINQIFSSLDFVKVYCNTFHYEYKQVTIKNQEPVPEPGPTETEQLRADVDFLAAMTGVTL